MGMTEEPLSHDRDPGFAGRLRASLGAGLRGPGTIARRGTFDDTGEEELPPLTMYHNFCRLHGIFIRIVRAVALSLVAVLAFSTMLVILHLSALSLVSSGGANIHSNETRPNVCFVSFSEGSC